MIHPLVFSLGPKTESFSAKGQLVRHHAIYIAQYNKYSFNDLAFCRLKNTFVPIFLCLGWFERYTSNRKKRKISLEYFCSISISIGLL